MVSLRAEKCAEVAHYVRMNIYFILKFKMRLTKNEVFRIQFEEAQWGLGEAVAGGSGRGDRLFEMAPGGEDSAWGAQ